MPRDVQQRRRIARLGTQKLAQVQRVVAQVQRSLDEEAEHRARLSHDMMRLDRGHLLQDLDHGPATEWRAMLLGQLTASDGRTRALEHQLQAALRQARELDEFCRVMNRAVARCADSPATGDVP